MSNRVVERANQLSMCVGLARVRVRGGPGNRRRLAITLPRTAPGGRTEPGAGRRSREASGVDYCRSPLIWTRLGFHFCATRREQ